MTITISSLQPVIALAAGVLILIVPRLLNFIVAIYLILVGLIGLGVFRVARLIRQRLRYSGPEASRCRRPGPQPFILRCSRRWSNPPC